jgi:hypothetical protein
MTHNIRRLGLVFMLAAASTCIAAPSAHAENLNLLCYESTLPNGRKIYDVFWIDSQNSIITVGSATGGLNNADDPTVDSISRTVPVTITPEAFTFGNPGSPEKIDRKTGFYLQANGKQERCWKGTIPLPDTKF